MAVEKEPQTEVARDSDGMAERGKESNNKKGAECDGEIENVWISTVTVQNLQFSSLTECKFLFELKMLVLLHSIHTRVCVKLTCIAHLIWAQFICIRLPYKTEKIKKNQPIDDNDKNMPKNISFFQFL